MRAFVSAKCLLAVVASLMLASCTTSRYQQSVDSLPEHRTPQRMAQILTQPEPSAIREPLSRRGNADEYEVWGKTYQVQKGLNTYSQQGIASWYGQKFHGHETSNGEIFDVYEFTAAHKSLPLPSYVRVTNLANQQTLIVRVNDRGPFHDNRLIDLSYAAAVRLGFDKAGTAMVKVDLIAPPLMEDDYQHIQIEAFSQRASAESFKLKIEQILSDLEPNQPAAPVYIFNEVQQGLSLHKVRIGPVSPESVDDIQSVLLARALNPGMLVSAPPVNTKTAKQPDMTNGSAKSANQNLSSTNQSQP